jgi:hypothetical protein
LNGEANRVRNKQSSAIIAADVRRFSYLIKMDMNQVFGTHSWVGGDVATRMTLRSVADKTICG